MKQSARWTLTYLSIFAVAMALLEAAVVVYMREVATIAMIVAVALLAERRNRTRLFGAFVFVFGTWDLFYYIWLKVLMDWPRTWLEWDVLFLIPMVWLGPWICPALIAALFMIWGGWAILTTRQVCFSVTSATIFVVGAALGLISFFQPAAAVSMASDELSSYVPGAFWWWLYFPGLVLMAVGFWKTIPASSQ